MKYGFILPYGDARTAADFAQAAEQAGWDGFFVWEPVWGIDAWVCLTAAAMRTERIRLGTMLSPLSRMRPWKLASETATLDNLSGGRVTLAVGLGAPETGFAEFGEQTDRKERAELLDEGLDILTGLWEGQPFNYQGKHYQIKEVKFAPPPPPVQKPRIPIWVVGLLGSNRSMKRVLRWDGLLPAKRAADGSWTTLTPEDLTNAKAFIEQNRTQPGPFDIVMEGVTSGDDPEADRQKVRSWAEAGATWWLEGMWDALDSMRDGSGVERVLRRVKQGPPRID